MAKKKSEDSKKKENRILRYFKAVRQELRQVTWPTRQATLRLTMIILAVTAIMSASLGLIDWAFSRLFALIVG